LYGFVGNNGVGRCDILGLLRKKQCIKMEGKTGKIAPKEFKVFGKKVMFSAEIGFSYEKCLVCCNDMDDDGRGDRMTTSVEGYLKGKISFSASTMGGDLPDWVGVSGGYWLGAQVFGSIGGEGKLEYTRKNCNTAEICGSVSLSGDVGLRAGGQGWADMNDIWGNGVYRISVGTYLEGRIYGAGWTINYCCPVGGDGLDTSGCEFTLKPGTLRGSVGMTVDALMFNVSGTTSADLFRP
jgi:hypothetical protein